MRQGHLVTPHLSRVVSTGVPTSSTPLDSKVKEKEVSGKQMLGILAGYVWPKDNMEVKARVVGALGLLVGAKVSRLRLWLPIKKWPPPPPPPNQIELRNF